MTLRFMISVLVVAGLARCGPSYSPDTYASNAAQQAAKVEQGIVVGVRKVAVSASGTVGTVTGAAAGGIAGSQVGVGPVSAFTALGGSLVGGLGGSAVEHMTADTSAYEYIVRKPNGDLISVTQKDTTPLALGQKVLVIAGTQARVVADYTVPPLVKSGDAAGAAKAADAPPAAKAADAAAVGDSAKAGDTAKAGDAAGSVKPADAAAVPAPTGGGGTAAAGAVPVVVPGGTAAAGAAPVVVPGGTAPSGGVAAAAPAAATAPVAGALAGSAPAGATGGGSVPAPIILQGAVVPAPQAVPAAPSDAAKPAGGVQPAAVGAAVAADQAGAKPAGSPTP